MSTANTSCADCAIQLIESDAQYIVSAQLPHLRKQDICVNVDSNQVTIAIDDTPPGSTAAQGRSAARSAVQVLHTCSLRHSIDAVKAYATYKDYQLELVLPKSVNGSRRLLIN